jgi:tellurite resistance protein
MRELAPETMAQLMEQLNDIAQGAPTAQAAKPGSGSDVDDVREALVETAFLIAAVDGEVSPLEIAQFGEAIEAAFGESDVDVKAMMATMSSRLEADGWDKRMRAVARALDGSHKGEGAYRIAVGVAFIDDDVAHAEAAALEAFARALGISEDRAHAIMGEVREELFG